MTCAAIRHNGFRADGKSFDWITEEDVTEFRDEGANGVRSVAEDKNGEFWFNTEYSYDIYDSTLLSSNTFYKRNKSIGDLDYEGTRVWKGTVFTKYKQFVNNCFNVLPRQALHAKSLGFVHPKTGENMFFESELPNDMKEVIQRWENYVANREGLE